MTARQGARPEEQAQGFTQGPYAFTCEQSGTCRRKIKNRAMATRCFSPPESRNPRSPTRVSNFSGNFMIVSYTAAALAAASISASEASGRPYKRLYLMDSAEICFGLIVRVCARVRARPRVQVCKHTRVLHPCTHAYMHRSRR